MQNATAIASNYNQLSELDEADFTLSKIEQKSVIEALLRVISKHDLASSFGIRLLHRHNEINDNELMAEYHRVDSDGFALITKATLVSDISSDYVPNSWQFRNGAFIPIEFSESSLVCDANLNPRTQANFFNEIALTLEQTKSQSVLGPSLLGSDFIESHRPEGHTILAEATAQDDRANILRFVKPTPLDNGKVVQTHWCVSPNNPDGLVTMTCTRICPSVQNPPVHQGTFIHNQS